MTDNMKPLHLPVFNGSVPEESGRYLIWYTYDGRLRRPFIGDYDAASREWMSLGQGNQVIAFAGPLPDEVPDELTCNTTHLNWSPERGLDVGFEGTAVSIMVEEFAKTFDQSGARNFLTMDFRECKQPFRAFEVTIQRKGGDTPAQRLDEAYAALRKCMEVLSGNDLSTATIEETIAEAQKVLGKGGATVSRPQEERPAGRGNAVEVGTISTADDDGATHAYKCAMLIEFKSTDECKRALDSGRAEFTVFGGE